MRNKGGDHGDWVTLRNFTCYSTSTGKGQGAQGVVYLKGTGDVFYILILRAFYSCHDAGTTKKNSSVRCLCAQLIAASSLKRGAEH